MPYVAKLNPEDFEAGNFLFRKSEKQHNLTIGENEEIFIWTAETAGGRGLIARCTTAERQEQIVVGLSTIMLLNRPILGKDELEPYRDIRDATLRSFLAEKLYYHSLNRTIPIPEQYATDLRRQFFGRFRLD